MVNAGSLLGNAWVVLILGLNWKFWKLNLLNVVVHKIKNLATLIRRRSLSLAGNCITLNIKVIKMPVA